MTGRQTNLSSVFVRFALFIAREVRKFLSSCGNDAWIRRVNILAEFAQNNLECELNFCAWSSMRHLKQSLYHFPPTYHRVNGYHLVTQKSRIVSKSAILNLGGKCARVGMKVLTVSSVACFGVKSASLYITSFKGLRGRVETTLVLL